MRITLTGRRLALAAVLVLAGVAAPLAYATITAPPAGGSTVAPTTFGRVAVAPTIVASPVSSRAPTDVGDNPYQVILSETFASGLCGFVPNTSPLSNYALDAVSFVAYSGAASAVYVSPVIKTGVGTSNLKQFGYRIPLDTDGNGDRQFSMLIKPNSEANAAIGDAYALNFCVLPSTPSVTFSIIVTGQKTAAGATPVAVSDFSARSGRAGTTLRWTTASETEILGFNVWRYRGAKGVKVNRTLVRAKRSGKPAGAAYSFVDTVRGAKRGLTYRLQLVDLKGKRTWYAAFAIASK